MTCIEQLNMVTIQKRAHKCKKVYYIITIVLLLQVLTTLVAILSEVHYKGLRILCNATH